MDDRFLDEMKSDWRRGEIDPGRMFRNLERRQRRLRLLLALEAAGGATAFGAAIWCGRRAATGGGALFGFAALVLLGSAMLSLMAMRPPSDSHFEEGPFGMLRRTRQHLEDLERAVTRWRWSAWILLVCSMAIWLFHHAGQTGLRETALLSAIWAGTAAMVGAWSGRRCRRIRREREASEHLLDEYRAADA